MSHPGHRPAHARTSFGVEREVELAALSSPRVRERVVALGLRLVSWSCLAAPRGAREEADRDADGRGGG